MGALPGELGEGVAEAVRKVSALAVTEVLLAGFNEAADLHQVGAAHKWPAV